MGRKIRQSMKKIVGLLSNFISNFGNKISIIEKCFLKLQIRSMFCFESRLKQWILILSLLLYSINLYCYHNKPPEEIMLSISRTAVESNDSVFISVSAIDPDNDSLTYTWSATAGILNVVMDDSVIWVAPEVNVIEVETLTVEIKDTHDASITTNISIIVVPQGGIWITKKPMPSRRWGHTLVAVDGKIYAIGGNVEFDTVVVISNLVEVYDCGTDTWSQKKPMPTPRERMGAIAIGNKIYVIGGMDNKSCLSTNEMYDILTDTWTTKEPMPTPRCGLTLAVVNGKIYALGGWNGSVLGTNEEYDPIADKWSTKASLPTPRAYLSATAYNDKIYAIGGFGVGFLNINEVYDPITDSWTEKAPMEQYRDGLAVVSYNNKIYAIGGRCMLPGEATAATEAYDPLTNSWETRTPMNTGRYYHGAAVVAGKIFVIGGIVGWYGTDKNEAYYAPSQ